MKAGASGNRRCLGRIMTGTTPLRLQVLSDRGDCQMCHTSTGVSNFLSNPILPITILPTMTLHTLSDGGRPAPELQRPPPDRTSCSIAGAVIAMPGRTSLGIQVMPCCRLRSGSATIIHVGHSAVCVVCHGGRGSVCVSTD